MSVSIAAQWTKETRDLNGLNSIEQALIGQPLTRRLAVIELETLRTTKDFKNGGTETPTILILHVEPVDGDDAETVRGMLDRLYTDRTGKTEEPVARTLLDGQGSLFSDDAGDEQQDTAGEPVSERPRDEWLDDATAEK